MAAILKVLPIEVFFYKKKYFRTKKMRQLDTLMLQK